MAQIVEDVKQVTPTADGPIFTHTHGEVHLDFSGLRRTLFVCIAVLLFVGLVLIALVFFAISRLNAAYPPPDPGTAERIFAFWAVFLVMTLLIFGLAIAVVVGLMWPKTFSLSDALSAPSPVQPKIEKASDILLIGSTSRLIAFVGLLGILCLALGVGYSVIFDIVMLNKAPQLTQVSWFLTAMASLFAPYLASQVKEAMMHSRSTAPRHAANDTVAK